MKTIRRAVGIIVTTFLILTIFGIKHSNAARQNPLKNPKICGRPICEPATSKFGYVDSKRYKYEYNVHLRTEFAGTGENTSEVFIKATVDLTFPKNCEGVLSLSHVKLWENSLTLDDKVSSSKGKIDTDTTYDYYGYMARKDYDDADDDTSSSASDEFDQGNLHSKSRDMATDLQKFDLRFAFHDGLISEVCPNVQEASWVLNFKKGILSAFQNTMMRFDVDLNTTETDVAGECNVAYSLEGTNDVFVLIRKTRDVASCRSRYSTHSILQTTPYAFRDDKAIWPILNSQSYCNMTIDHNIYREVDCYERHQLIPFSNNETGAITTSQVELILKAEESYNSGDFFAYEDEHLIERRSTLIFDHTPPTKPTHGEIKASRDLLKQMCTLGYPNIQREFIDVFTNFLHTTKNLDYKALTQLLARSESICSNGKNHVLESLPYIASTASYQVMRDQIVGNAIPKFLAHNWMTSLAFIQRPDDETLDTFYTILEFSRKKIDPEYTLGASAVIHSFCRHNPDCGEHPKIQKIINLLETEFLNLFNMFKNERRTRERLIVILKGLGNIGVISDQFAEQLQAIITEDIAPVDIRLESVIVFRRVDCFKYRKFFIDVYSNFTINSEIRIFSYIQTMRCPDYKTIYAIKSVLEMEPVNQVGSYVWSHLKNVAKSSSPVRVEAQSLLVNDDLSDKFQMDIRKFSRNYEHSLFFDEYNFGSSADMNLIYGTDSYLPRMMTLNFTADLFGQSVNFFELSARAEGFEELASSIFGPKGPLSRDTFRKKLSFLNRWIGDDSREDDDTIENLLNIESPIRMKRDSDKASNVVNHGDSETDDSLFASKRRNSIRKEVDELGYKLKYNYDHPRAAIGLRMFGNDMQYHTVEGMLEVMSASKEFDPLYQIAKILSGNQFVYTKSRVFMDASYTVPLSIGVPLSISAFGASSVDFRVSGHLDRLESSSEWHFDVDGKLKPSVSVDVISSMQSDLFYAVSGVRMKSNLYSSSEVEAKFKVRGKNLISVSFDIPQDKNEIFSARSELVVIKETEEIPQPGIERRRANTTCTWPILDRAIGLKLCSSYSVPDLSNATNVTYPGLILSGPLNLSLILAKSDLTAKKFVFEYELRQEQNDSNLSLVFHTPGSATKRLLTANISSIPDILNASVHFVNGPNSYSAGGIYKANPDDRRLDVFLETNGRKNLNLNVEMTRSQERTAWIYRPRMLLSVNGENITGLLGKIRINAKNDIVQNDIELTFETKRLQALLKGNIIQTEITTSTNLTVNYRFQAKKVESIQLEGKLTNKGDKSKTEYHGDVKLRTSAYPKLNFASNATWFSLQGHTEGLLTYNNSPLDFIDPNQTSSVRLIFIRSVSDDFGFEGSRTKASFEVKLPKANMDYRIMVKHEERNKNGSEHNVIFGLRYSAEKETTALFSFHLPRRNLFAIDALMNVSVPEFDSCVARLRLFEKIDKNYMINFNGTWFSGHSIAVRGFYKDKTSRYELLHHLKLIVESPSFEMTTLNALYRRNQLMLFLDFQATHNKDPYRFTIQYASTADRKNSTADVRLQIKERDYWLLAKVLSEQQKLLHVEIHLDRLRDINLMIGAMIIDARKELSLEIKWDANRDPSQRLSLLAEYNNPGNKFYEGTISLIYPDRTISCGFKTYTGGPIYNGTARAGWSANDVVTLSYEAGFNPATAEVNTWIRANLETPFDGWRQNRLSAGGYNMGNLILMNSSLLWADNQKLELKYKSDYEMTEQILSFDLRVGINSSVKDIPTISAKVKHWQDMNRFDTDIDLRYTGANGTFNIYSIKSNWDTCRTAQFQNISGSVLIVSPFENYRKVGFATKFSLSENRTIRGAASLNYDTREFTLAMDGYMKKFTDNMLVVNITTPLEKFRTINGRFGLNEKRHHAVAEMRAPTVALGAEILCDIVSLINFDVKLSLATPIEGFKQMAFCAKVKPDTVDMRGSWNHATLGFTGVWRMVNTTDFEYSYKVYTPFKNFEENGLVLKYIRKDVFVLEAHGKFSTYKLGLRMNGKPKSELLKQLGDSKLELELLYDADLQPPDPSQFDEDYDINDIDLDDFFAYYMEFELDTLVWPTMNGMMDVQEIRDFYIIVGNVQIPNGNIQIKDRIYFPDLLNVKNVLNVQTPFHDAKHVKSIFEYHVDLDRFFRERVDIFISNGMDPPIELGFNLNYTKVLDDLKPKQHEITLMVKTPFEILNQFDIGAFLQLEENICKGNISLKTNITQLSLGAAVETEDDFLETSVGVSLNTNVVPNYACRAYFKKDFSTVDKSIDIQFEVDDDGVLNKLAIDAFWHSGSADTVNGRCRIQTTMLPLRLGETALLLSTGSNLLLNFDMTLISQLGERIEYGTRASKKKDTFNVEIWTPMQNFRNISMRGSITPSKKTPNEYMVSGALHRNMAVYVINGVIKIYNGYPAETKLRIQPKAGGPDGVIELKLTEHHSKAWDFQFSAVEDGRMCQISGGYSFSDDGLDCSVLVQSTEPEISRISMNGKLVPDSKQNMRTEIAIETPWKQLGIESVRLRSEFYILKESGKLKGEYQIGKVIGRGSCQWSWLLAENMHLILESYLERPDASPRSVHASVKYSNPNKSFQRLLAGGQLNVDSKWNLELNGSVAYLSEQDVQMAIDTLLPEPVGDVHHIGARYRGNLMTKEPPNVFLEGKYESEQTRRRFLSRASYRNVDDLQGLGRIEWGEDGQFSTIEGDFQMLRKREVRKEFYAKLITPKYQEQDTFFLSGHYDRNAKNFQEFVCTLDLPATRRLAEVDVEFQSLSNMHGILNSTTPFLNVSWLRADFNFSSEGEDTLRYLKGSWPQDFAFFKLQSNYGKRGSQRILNGTIQVEVPLASRHQADIQYGHVGDESLDKGHINVVYNDKQVLDGQYKRTEKHMDSGLQAVLDVTLENDIKPLGVHYVSTNNWSNPRTESDIKHIEVFELRNEAVFNITGELYSRPIDMGYEYKIVAIHPNRTVIFTTEFENADEQSSKQRSKLELSPTAWIGYNIQISNHSTAINDSQSFAFEVSYPKRTLSTEGWYYRTDEHFESDIALKWTIGKDQKEKKIVRAGMVWQVEPLMEGDRDNQSIVVTVGHPFLEKDVTIKGLYYRGIVDLLKADLTIDYAEDPDHLVELKASLRDLSSVFGHMNYTLNLLAQHKASDLDVNVKGTAAAKSSYYKTETHALYKRGYFPAKKGMFLVKLDLNRKEVEYERISPYRAVRFWAIPYASHPVYGLNCTVWDAPDMNNTGFVYVNLERMFTRMEVNLSEDATQNLQMVGYIPDARSGYLEVWRNYEEIRVIDISSYLKINHSRLITGRFHWRPKIEGEIKDKIRAVGTSFYESFSDGIDFWIKSLYSETIESINEVWGTAKIHTQSFLDDVGELSVLEEDLQDLRKFVNQSYDANDFYIKTVVNFTLTILDELAIRDHIESLPKIFSELWQAMGDSGKALRKSIMWLIETIKTTYNSILDAVSRFFHGESLHYLSNLMEKGIEKYDKFVKDLHISFIKYVENLWNKFWSVMSSYWRNILKRIEPHLFKFLHYVESAAWNISKEVFDFIYKRTNELAESPYFNQVSSFTQDIDRLYKDIKSHDALTNLKKYSIIAWNFLKEKYFKLVPFGAELNEVLTEIWGEIKSLEKLEHVQVLLQKWNEIVAKVEWIAEELQIEMRLHQLYALVRNKFHNYAMNALETADMYREAKTKFIFDPEVGIIDLEQKLPMSWHAFNETPKFEEIPEYRFLMYVQDVFTSTNTSLVKYIYSLRIHLDPNTWLPPYQARSLLIGSRHFMSFDKRFVSIRPQPYSVSGKCSYLLAHDFFQRNFTLLIETSTSMEDNHPISSRKLTLLTNDQLLDIDLGGDSFVINGNATPMIPAKIGEVIIFRDLDIITIQSEDDFSLNCNIQFDLCWFEISGWYFGRTAGLLGTINNEQFDELTSSQSTLAFDETEFTDSWKLESCTSQQKNISPPRTDVASSSLVDDGRLLCDHFFKAGILSACYETVDVRPFLDMCIDMASDLSDRRRGQMNAEYRVHKSPCTAALAYIEACNSVRIPIRVPDQCVHCQLLNGSFVSEGTFVTLRDEEISRSTDIVFIIEAKPCNAELTINKSLMLVVETLEEQLLAAKIVDNRYAVVSFGGRAPFDKPRNIVYQNHIFTKDSNDLRNYFDYIRVANGTNNDILEAISVASKLNFRPGVSKTFILLPCSDCAARSMKFDYTSIMQFMLEEGVNLHILADMEFEFEKTRKLRHFFGLDRDFVYSKRFLDGDSEVRKQLHVPKYNLGICTPLALETNGSVFSARKLVPERKNPVKRFATIFAKRVAKSAAPNTCQVCECTGHNTGVAYMTCAPCELPTKSAADDYQDFEFNDWEWDDEEEVQEI